MLCSVQYHDLTVYFHNFVKCQSCVFASNILLIGMLQIIRIYQIKCWLQNSTFYIMVNGLINWLTIILERKLCHLHLACLERLADIQKSFYTNIKKSWINSFNQRANLNNPSSSIRELSKYIAYFNNIITNCSFLIIFLVFEFRLK